MSRSMPLALATLLLVAFPYGAAAQSCNYGEPPSSNPANPRVIDGSNGHHVVLMDCTTATGTGYINSVAVSNLVYFRITPLITGPMRMSTCHPNTLYDTVLGLYDAAGNYLDFNDDSLTAECDHICYGRPSELTYDVTAGNTYLIRVGAYNGNPYSCPLCLGLIVSIGTPCGDPPRNFICELARDLPTVPGTTYTVLDTTDLDISYANWPCQPSTTQVAWFRFEPLIYGQLTVNTCNAGTNYDTVLRLLSGQCGGSFLQLDCQDDPGCTNFVSTAAWITARVFPGTTYYILAGAYNGTADCLELEVTFEDLCATDTEPPLAELALADFSCLPLGQPAALSGGVADPEGNLTHWQLAERAINSPTWNYITFGNNPTSGTLATWTPTAAGYRIIQLTADDACGHTTAAARLIYVDAGPTAYFNWPSTGQSITGTVCIDGYVAHGVCPVNYSVDYRPPGGSTWTPVEGVVSYPGPVANLTLANWNTLSPLVVDGTYELRVRAVSTGGSAEDWVMVDVDNTAPTAEITEPLNCQPASNLVAIYGSAFDAHLSRWYLDFTGGPINHWIPIADGTFPVVSDLLAEWDTTGMPACAYTLRLRVYEPTTACIVGNRYSEFLTTVLIGGGTPSADLDGDGDVDLADFTLFALWYTGPHW